MKCLVINCLLFVSVQLYAQTIKGNVYSVDGESLNGVIFFKESSSQSSIKEYVNVRAGIFSKKLAMDYDTLIIEVKSEAYNGQVVTIRNPIKEKLYAYDFVLAQKEEQLLEEVFVKAKKRSFKVKQDTVSYQVSEWLDGSERKIDEVIARLPGIDLNEKTGEIKYKGKSIETVTLDGDNLFDYNYTLGTKNINVGMVERIEAIDNYSDNPLLKGIESGGKVALNLKLKKGKVDFSGDLDFGSGWFKDGSQAHNISSNLLGVTKVYKSFATLSYNNVGVNQTPFDYFGFNSNAEQRNEQDYFAEKIIPETLFSNILDDRRSNINNQFFGNYNAIFKLNSKLTIKTNLYYLQDRITTNQIFQNDFRIDDDSFTTLDNTFITKKPQQYRGDLEFKYNTSKKSLLEYNIRFRQENIETPSQIVQNESQAFSSNLTTSDFYFKQSLHWTKKIAAQKALQLSVLHAFNSLPQRLRVTPASSGYGSVSNLQESEFKKTVLHGKATYLGSVKRDKYAFTIGGSRNQSPFLSSLLNEEDLVSQNSFDYLKSNVYNHAIYTISRGNWRFSPSYTLQLLHQRLVQNTENQANEKNSFLFEPNLQVKYVLNSASFLSLNLSYNQNTNAEQYFFLNRILINNRTSIRNTPSLELQKSQRYGLSYFNNDLYNQFQLSVNIRYENTRGNFFANQNITQNATQLEYFFLPQENSNWRGNIKTSKYIPFISSTLKFTSSYAIFNFRNIVNNSDLRLNRSQSFRNALFWKTAFELPFNFENTLSSRHTISKNVDQSPFRNTSLHNEFKIIYKPNSNWFFIVSSNYYLPNTKNTSQEFFFLDATAKYAPSNKNWKASLLLRNLTNESNFEHIQTSDISTSIFRSNLLERYLMVSVACNF